MADIVTPTLLALDIGASKHAFAFDTGRHQESGEVRNDPTTLRTFLAQLIKRAGTLRLIVEATGIYYLDVALIASELGAEVMVVNPRASANFGKVLQQRSKTDALDAAMLLEYLRRMPFVAWVPPRQALLELRYYGRYLTQLTEDRTAALNRLHALEHARISPKALRKDLKQAIASLERRIERIRGEALALIKADEDLLAAYRALVSFKGIAEVSAVSILAEVMVMPSTLSSRACVSHAGLDVRLHQSGTSVNRPARISKHGNKYLRRALYMPALSAIQHDPHARAFNERLLARGKKKMQALVAVMRKMLTAVWALVRQPAQYDGSRLYAVTIEG